MLKRLPYRDAPVEVQKLIDDLQQNGEYVIIEDEKHQPVACISLLPDAEKACRAEGARELREILSQVPPSPYSEEETYRLIDEAIAAIRQQDKQAVS